MLRVAPTIIAINKNRESKILYVSDMEITLQYDNTYFECRVEDEYIFIKGLKVGSTSLLISNGSDTIVVEVFIRYDIPYRPDVDYIKLLMPYFEYDDIGVDNLNMLIDEHTEMVKSTIINNGFIEPTIENDNAIYPLKLYIVLIIGETLTLRQVVNSDIINYLREKAKEVWAKLEIILAKVDTGINDNVKLYGKVIKP